MVLVDTVYQRVLALANKEQRGYITPQEFNLYANQAQMDIFEQYFYDLNQYKRIPGNDSEFHDMIDLIEEKLYDFKTSAIVTNGTPINSLGNIETPFYRLGDVYALQQDYSGNNVLSSYNENPLGKSTCVQQVKYEDLIKTQNSPLTRASNSRPVYWVQNGNIYFLPTEAFGGSNYQAIYIKKPRKVNWTYIVVDEKALYNSGAVDHQDFELHISEETKLVIKILQLAGVAIKDYNLTQVAAQKEVAKIQQEKQ